MTQPPGGSDSYAGAPWLLGRWRLLHAAPVLGFLDGTRMEFLASGELAYTIIVQGSAHHVSLVYRVDGDVLRTENPLAPHATAVPFRAGPGDTLVLDFPDSPAVLVREQPGAPGF
jgi:hypothetical protein